MKDATLTRRTLLASVLSLTLCFAMLLGTTFAWFTDKATTGANAIISGNLDVALLDGEGKSLENATDLFRDAKGSSNILWEPNATFKTIDMFVKNEGNLELKYRLIVNITGEDAAKLIEVVTFTVTMGGETVDLNAFEGKLAVGEMSDAIVIKGHMAADAGNDYKNLNASLSLTVIATQVDAEFDSFDNEYDKDAVYADHYATDAASLQEALNEGGTVALMNDIDLSGVATYSLRSSAAPATITIPADTEATIDLNGYNIIASSAVADSSVSLIDVSGKLNVVGEGTIALYDISGASFNNSYRHAAIVVKGGEVNLEEGVTVMCTSADESGATAMSYAVDMMPQTDAVLNVNGANLYSTYIGVRIWALYSANGTLNYNSGLIQGDKKGYDVWAQGMDQKGTATVNTADGISYTTTDISGTIYMFDSDNAIIATANGLANALLTGGEYVLMNDIGVDADETMTVPADVTVELDLNGKTIAGVTDDADKNDDGKITSADNEVMIDVRGTLTVKNGTLTLKHESDNLGWNGCTEVFYVAFNGTLNLDGVTVENLGGSDMAYAIDLVNATNITLNVTDSTLKSTYIPLRVFNNGSGMNNVTVEDTDLIGTSRAVWVHIYSDKDNGGKGIKDQTLNLDFFGNGNTFTANDPYRIIEFGFDDEINFDANGAQIFKVTTPEELVAAIAGGAEVVILNKGEYTIPTLAGKEGFTLVGAEGTVVGGENADTGFSGNFGKDSTIKNVTFSGASNGVRWSYAQGGTSVFENCSFEGDERGGFHIDQGNGATLIFNDCTFSGFNALAGDLAKVVFNNCTFLNNGKYNGLNMYCDVELNGCTFEFVGEGSEFIDYEAAGRTLTINDCTATMNGEAMDVADKLGGTHIAQTTITIDGVVVEKN